MIDLGRFDLDHIGIPPGLIAGEAARARLRGLAGWRTVRKRHAIVKVLSPAR
jgi:hypothetical protein